MTGAYITGANAQHGEVTVPSSTSLIAAACNRKYARWMVKLDMLYIGCSCIQMYGR